MSKPELGRLEKVDLRACWESEPRDFTPWLAEEDNIALLGKTLGIELEVQQTEASVGSFSADIVCRNTADNTVVLIENQLERTDHTHLGQILTYAAGLEAVTVVWIASRFTEEHRAAVDWFNSISQEEFNFFGIEIEVWRIGDSLAAPKFNIVAKPNEWARQVKEAGTSPGATTPAQKNWIEYWGSFAEFLEARGRPWTPPKPQRCHWVAWGLGRSHFTLQASVGFGNGHVDVYVALEDKDSKSFFHQLRAMRTEIEEEAGFSMDWQERTDIKTSYVDVQKAFDLNNRSTWPEAHAWMLEHLKGLDRAFRPRIKSLNAADWQPEEATVEESMGEGGE
jgi:hypothetical protein